MKSFLRSSAALGISAVLCSPPMILAVAKTTTIISLSDDPVTDGVAPASASLAIKGDDSGEKLAEQ